MTVVPCPDCRAPLTGGPSCPSCGLRLVGPDAARLWEVDQQLAALGGERLRLLAALRTRQPTTTSASTAVPATAREPVAAAQPAHWQSPVAQEWTPQRVQNTLLSLGALLLVIAGIVFTAVTYDRLGAGGRAVVLLTLTALAGLAVPRLLTRRLLATAEAVAAVALALCALDAYGLRTLGLAQDSNPPAYAAYSALALAVVCGLYAAVVPVRLPRYAGVVLPHLAVVLLVIDQHAGVSAAALVFALVAAADVAALAALSARPVKDVPAAVVVCGGAAAALATLLGTTGVAADGRGAAPVALLVLAVAAGCAALLTADRFLRPLLLAVVAPLVAVASLGVAADLADVRKPLVVAAVGLLAVQAAALLPRDWRLGPVVGALAVTAGALVTQAEPIGQALALPFAWLDQPWTLVTGRDARHALAPVEAWHGTVVTLIVLVVAAVCTAGAGLALHRLRAAVPAAAVLVVAAAVVLPLGLATSYPMALILLLAVSIGLLTGAAADLRAELSVALFAAGALVALLATAWATADQDATLLVLPVVTLAFAGVATRRPEATLPAALSGGAFLAAAGAARDLHADQVGGLLLLAPVVLVGLTFALAGLRRLALEVAAVVLLLASVALTVHDAGWLSWTFALAGLLALADALHPDRRAVAAAGALLLSASSWVRLADADVTAPEPYVVPLGLVALGFGWLRARRTSLRSFPAYGPGLTLLLVPSLLASFDDATVTRPLLLAVASLAVLLVGARLRLQAPLVLGGGVLVVDALQLLAPYAVALPRWLTLGAAGLLLVGVGATYEQRRRDVERLRRSFATLT
jgi:hypothetical protein